VLAGADISAIHLGDMSERPRTVPNVRLRTAVVASVGNIVSGRRLTLEDIAAVLELGGLPTKAGRVAGGGSGQLGV
jgi:hypothetical protein